MPQTQPPVPETDAPSKASFWYDPKVRAVLYQIGALLTVGMLDSVFSTSSPPLKSANP